MRGGVHAVGGKQDLLLLAEVLAAVLAPVRKERVARRLRGERGHPAQLCGHDQRVGDRVRAAPARSTASSQCPRAWEQDVVLLVDVLVEVELEPVERVEQRPMRPAQRGSGVVVMCQLAQRRERVAGV